MVYIKKGDEKEKDKVNYKQVGSPFWEPENNNIRIKVLDNRSTGWDNENSLQIGHFNRPGETGAPYIIAVPTTQMWTSESDDFPINTFTELPSTLTPDNNN